MQKDVRESGGRYHLLIVEDAISVAEIHRTHLAAAGYDITLAHDGKSARKLTSQKLFDVILLDISLPDVSGLELLQEWRQRDVPSQIIAVTANASIASAVEAVRLGAHDYLVKPVTRDRLVTTVRNALNLVKLERQTQVATPKSQGTDGFNGLIGSSAAMRMALEKIKSVAKSRASVFITGESGTGKELCAEAIHANSPRATGPFVAINCGAIPKDLIESEIFGHLKGSFTGAIADRMGAAALADGGTLFLDEICEMDLALQTKLLRFLQTGLIQRVGASSTEKVDIRVICATNRSPLDEVREKRFREDLFFRLHVLPVRMPPLRERGDDVIEIASHFVEQFSREEGKVFAGLSADAMQCLRTHRWPGNVRELQNVIRQAVVLHDGDIIELNMLSPAIEQLSPDASFSAVSGLPGELDVSGLHEASRQMTTSAASRELWQIERDAIEQAITDCGGSVPKAARALGVSPSTIYRKRENWQKLSA